MLAETVMSKPLNEDIQIAKAVRKWKSSKKRKNRRAVSWLSRSLFPGHENWEKLKSKLQAHRVDQTLLPPSCIASSACVCMMAACPLQKSVTDKIKAERNFTSVQMVQDASRNRMTAFSQEIKMYREAQDPRNQIRCFYVLASARSLGIS